MCNEIFDPLYDFPLSYESFKEYIIKKYGSITNAKTTVKEYIQTGYIDPITGEVFELPTPVRIMINDPAIDSAGYSGSNGGRMHELLNNIGFTRMKYETVYCYDWEVEQNDNKRKIKLVDKIYLNRIIDDLEEIFK